MTLNFSFPFLGSGQTAALFLCPFTGEINF